MDIIDIMLAKALSQPADVYKYAEQAAKAAKSAQDAADSADDAIASVEAAATDIDDKVAAATDFLTIAEQALEDAREAGVTKTMLDLKADKADTILDTTLSRGRREETDIGTGSIAFGNGAAASGNYSASFGNYNMASGNNSFAEGSGTTASGQNSHAEGNNTEATGIDAHAEGASSQATNSATHAEGSRTIASGETAHAEGFLTTASGHAAHAEGGNTTASGTMSHAEGIGTTANALAGHASGIYNVTTPTYPIWTANTQYQVGDKVADKVNPFINYECITANSDSTFKSSKWKKIPTNTENYVTIGNGTADNARSNAYALAWHGNGYYKGNVYVNANSDSSGGVKLTPIPAGGTAGQVLAKKSGTDYDLKWVNQSGGGGGGGSYIGPEDAGHMVTVDSNGYAIGSDITEEQLVELIIASGAYQPQNAVGLEINYADRSFRRIYDSANYNMGNDFNNFIMYKGRIRCNVDDNGSILAFYGDSAYRDDGTNGQVMVYQPKFYYQRVPVTTENATRGKIVRKEMIALSPVAQVGFKLAPIFKNADGEELDYVLLSAYEGSIVNDKMTSIANSKPVANKTIVELETAATARGQGWHIYNMAATSADQMLEMVEFGQMNGQNAIEAGISSISGSSSVNCASITGSTSGLGNSTGAASYTISDIGGSQTTQTTAGKRAISYRGVENPWGNIWRLIGGTIIRGDGASQGGTPFICTNFNYTPDTVSSNYEDIGFNLPSSSGWVNAMGYGNSKYDWVYLPIESGNSASSALPVGDKLYTIRNLSEKKVIVYGGPHNHSDSNGAFYYGADRNVADSARINYGARLMFIPTKNSTYTANITKWTNKVGA